MGCQPSANKSNISPYVLMHLAESAFQRLAQDPQQSKRSLRIPSRLLQQNNNMKISAAFMEKSRTFTRIRI